LADINKAKPYLKMIDSLTQMYQALRDNRALLEESVYTAAR
jgi:hypothetical protein